MHGLSHEGPVPRTQRVRRLRRLLYPKTWRSLLLGITDPVNDPHWEFIDKRGTHRYLEQPTPWLAPGVADEIEQRLTRGNRVFEWGAGSSTLWFVSLGFSVTSHETDRGWAEDVSRRSGGRADVRFTPLDGDYTRPGLEGYALVLIDGRERTACGMHAAAIGSSGQIVVFDDSHRKEYQEAVQALSGRASWQQHYPGLSAMMTPKLTSVFVL